MNCGFCKTKLFDSDRECPRCGAPIHVETNKKKENKRFASSICDSYVYYENRVVAIGKTLIDSATDANLYEHGTFFYNPMQFYICDFDIRESIKDFIYLVKITVTLYEEKENCVETGKRSLFFPKSKVLVSNNKNLLTVNPLLYIDEFSNSIYGYIQGEWDIKG